MRFWRLKTSLSVFLATFCSAVFCLFFYAVNACKLSAISGQRAFYLYSPSSQAVIVDSLRFSELGKIKGESVAFDLRENPQTLLESILERYDAEVLFIEKSGESVSYYCYTKKWENALSLNGARVNLHIALGNERAKVGTPIIFGGF